MGFSKEIIIAALVKKEDMRKAAEQAASARKQAAYDRHPELTRLDMEISATGSAAAVAALSGENLDSMKSRITSLSEKKLKILSGDGCCPEDFEPAYSCPECADSGFSGGKLCRCVSELCKALTCESMSAEMPLFDCRFDNFDLKYYSEKPLENGVVPRKRMTAIFGFCKEYAAGFSKDSGNILFNGNTGLGKTHLSLAIAGDVIKRGYGVIYGPAAGLLRKIEKEHFGGNSTSVMDGILGCDLLIIDDLGTEFITQFSISVVNNIINTRLLENRSTIISTNCSLKELEEKYTPRVTSRIIGSYSIKQFVGLDIRQQKQLNK